MNSPIRTEDSLVPRTRAEMNDQAPTTQRVEGKPMSRGRLVAGLRRIEERAVTRFGVGDLVAVILMGLVVCVVSAPASLGALLDPHSTADVVMGVAWAVMTGATSLLIAVGVEMAISRAREQR